MVKKLIIILYFFNKNAINCNIVDFKKGWGVALVFALPMGYTHRRHILPFQGFSFIL